MVLEREEVNTKMKLRICPAFFNKVFYTSAIRQLSVSSLAIYVSHKCGVQKSDSSI